MKQPSIVRVGRFGRLGEQQFDALNVQDCCIKNLSDETWMWWSEGEDELYGKGPLFPSLKVACCLKLQGNIFLMPPCRLASGFKLFSQLENDEKQQARSGYPAKFFMKQ
eukprot:4438317-Amphidinium_carterae.1